MVKLFKWQLPKESSYRIEYLTQQVQDREDLYQRVCKTNGIDPDAEEFLAAQPESPDDDDAHPEAASSNRPGGQGSGKGCGKDKGKGKSSGSGKGSTGRDSKGKGSGWLNRAMELTRAYNAGKWREFEYLANEYYLWWESYHKEWHRFNGKGKGSR